MGFGEGCGDGPENVTAIGKKKRIWMPALPMPVAVLCCILNFIVPGLGTIISGLCVFCCARNEDMTCGEKCCSCTACICLGLLQLVCTPILFLGWIWSCVWGVMFIGMSNEYYHHNTVYTRSTTDVVVTQPASGDQQQFVMGGQQYGPSNFQYGHGQQPPPAQYPYGQYPVPVSSLETTHQYIPTNFPQQGPAPENYHPEKPPAYEDNRPEPSAPLEPPPPYSPK